VLLSGWSVLNTDRVTHKLPLAGERQKVCRLDSNIMALRARISAQEASLTTSLPRLT
jgi:hypothetical protein